MPAVQMRRGRDPFEVTLLVATLACGIALIISDARPRSVTSAMPALVELTWEWGLIVAGVVGLVAVLWRGDLAIALGVELGAMVLLGTTTSMYAIALFAVSGKAALAAGSFITAVAVAAWWRAAQILRALNALAEAPEPIPVVVPKPLSVERDRQ